MKIELSNAFIEKTKKEIKPHWGPLGWVTYKRTYARWLEDKNRSEEWDETVKRVVEGNINLDPRLKGSVKTDTYLELQHEAEQLFKLIYGLSGAASGRNLWISGTEFQKKNADALNNCWFISIKPRPYGESHIVPFYLKNKKNVPTVSMPFSFTFDELMKGGGVGFSVVKNNVKEMPVVDQRVDLTIIVDRKHKDYDELMKSGAIDKEEYNKNKYNDVLYYRVPDSREGWVIGNALLIDSHFSKTIPDAKNVILDVSDIRPKGERIKGFGGVAAGPVPYVEMLFSINKVINNAFNKKLSSVDCTDICNLIGKNVVAGNVRRSAEIALGSPDDKNFITMKQDQEALMDHRWASNNSIIVNGSTVDYQDIASAIAKNGEPGIVNLDLARNYGRIIDGYQEGIDKDVNGTNPCGEISLDDGEPCNLFEVFPSIAIEQGWDMREVFRLATRFAKRITFSNYEWEISRKTIQKNRRIGISISGIQDWVIKDFGERLVTGYKLDKDEKHMPIFNKEAAYVFSQFYQHVIDADIEYSKDLKCNTSIKHTTVKPSGTVSKLAGVSEGMHFAYDRYIIQRIRFQDSDPILKALKACGYHIEDDVYSENTKCVEFYVKAENADHDEFMSANDVSIEEQIATQAFLQTYWADNSVSCTITFHPDEQYLIGKLLRKYSHMIKSTSMLPYSGHGFKQAPKEPITKKVYEEKVSHITNNVQKVFNQMNQDKKDLEIVGQKDCAGGACPIK